MANYLTIRVRLLIAILASVLPLSTMKAEEGKDVTAPSQGWYVGVEGGMPFGFSTFSSFGHDKTHPCPAFLCVCICREQYLKNNKKL